MELLLELKEELLLNDELLIELELRELDELIELELNELEELLIVPKRTSHKSVFREIVIADELELIELDEIEELELNEELEEIELEEIELELLLNDELELLIELLLELKELELLLKEELELIELLLELSSCSGSGSNPVCIAPISKSVNQPPIS